MSYKTIHLIPETEKSKLIRHLGDEKE